MTDVALDPAAAADGRLPAPVRLVGRALEGVTAVLLVAMVVVALTQVLFRYGLNASLSWPEEAARWSFVWFVFLGLAVATARRGHVSIDLLTRFFGPGGRRIHRLAVLAVAASASIVLVVHGSDMVQRSSYVSPAMGLPFTWLYLAAPVGAGLNLLFIAAEGRRAPDGFPLIGLAACLAGGLLYLAVAFGGGLLPGLFGKAAALVAVALLLIAVGVPVVYALVFSVFVAFAGTNPLLLLTITQNMTSALDSFILLAIPFFILAASVMNQGGITGFLIDLAARLVGHLRGGLAYVNVLTNTMLAGLSGSSMADAAAIAKTLVPSMERHGYDRPFSCALTSAAGVLANLIPPSLGLIIYGALASASVGALFVASIVPGLLVAAALCITVAVIAARRGLGADLAPATGAERRSALGAAIPALILPVIVVGGVRFGVFTATEAGAVAVAYAALCGLVFYRRLSGRGALLAVREAAGDTASVMVIIAAAAPFSWVLVTEQVPQVVAATLAASAGGVIALMLLINLFLLVVGLFMEMIAAMVILVPILLPTVQAAGIDVVHFGIILVVNLVIGALTPPLGMLVFVTARVGEADVVQVFRAVVPFLLALVVVLGLVTFVPALSLFLPGVLR